MRAEISGTFTGRAFPPLNEEVTPLRPFEHIYGHYKWEQHDELFAKSRPGDLAEGAEFNDDPFTQVIRIKLIYELLRSKAENGGCGFHLPKMLHDGKIKAIFPLHNKVESDKLGTQRKRTRKPLWRSVVICSDVIDVNKRLK